MTDTAANPSQDWSLSLVIPARNESASLPPLIALLTETLERAHIPYEILVINDSSSDDTDAVMSRLSAIVSFARAQESGGESVLRRILSWSVR